MANGQETNGNCGRRRFQLEISIEWGYVLGPILFLVYINGLEEVVTGNILKFADDTKLFRKTKEIGDKQNYKKTLIN